MPIPYRVMAANDEVRRKGLAVLDTGRSYGGEDTQRFEVELARTAGTRYGVVANSGTSSLLLALEALGIGPGDEVIMAATAYVGVLASVVKAGARPVFVDADYETRNISPDAVRAAIAPRTRAIVPVHMYGFPCDLDPIVEAARAHGAVVIEDAAHALGASYKDRPVGGIGEAGFFSFSGKMITVFGPGGAAVTSNRQLAEDMSSLRDQGRIRSEELSFIRRTDGAWYDQAWIGHNMHMTEICAALGRIQLRSLGEFTAHRRRAAAYYTQRFRDADLPLGLPPARPWANPCYLHYSICTPARDGLRSHLRNREIEASIHYPTPLHMLTPVRARYGTSPGQFPVAERLCGEVLSLPVGPHMTPAMQEEVADAVVDFFARGRSGAAPGR